MIIIIVMQLLTRRIIRTKYIESILQINKKMISQVRLQIFHSKKTTLPEINSKDFFFNLEDFYLKI